MRIGNKLRRVKWWFQRANRKVTPDEWWDFKYNLADFISQGLQGLLYEGATDWDSDEKKDLEYILDWALEFPYYESALVVTNEQEKSDLYKDKEYFQEFGVLVITIDEAKEFDKKTQKAFSLLAKRIHSLWD